jgi:hypothetical protein
MHFLSLLYQVILQGGWSLLVPMSVLTMIVFPKVQRVLSGEKVVVSSMVGGRFSINQSAMEAPWQQQTPIETTDTTSSTGQRPGPLLRKISLGVDDPLPQELEGLLFNVQNVLRGVTTKIAQGRAPTQLDLTRLGEEVALLSDELAVVDFVNALQSSNTSRWGINVPKVESKEQGGSDDHSTLQSINGRKLVSVPSLDEKEEENEEEGADDQCVQETAVQGAQI